MNRAVTLGLEEAHAAGKIPYNKEYLGNVLKVGICKGYPDQAIHDMAGWLQNNQTYKLEKTRIPNTRIYNEAEPNFGFLPAHKEDSGIQSTVNQWGKLLGDFYATPWHQNIKKDTQFIQARKPLDQPNSLK